MRADRTLLNSKPLGRGTPSAPGYASAMDGRRFAGLELRALTAAGVFSGYASLFGTVDLGMDAIAPGAFSASLARRGAAGVRMLYQHDPTEPIGSWRRLSEDGRGLFVEGELALGVRRADEVYRLMKAGALDGLSIGFRTEQARNERDTGIRRILKADLWEISVVTFPMQPEARVSNVKHARFYRDRDTELARQMRRAAEALFSR